MNQTSDTVVLTENLLHNLQAIAEAAAHIASELGNEGGAINIRTVISRVNKELDQKPENWDSYGSVNEWLRAIKGTAPNPISHSDS